MYIRERRPDLFLYFAAFDLVLRLIASKSDAAAVCGPPGQATVGTLPSTTNQAHTELCNEAHWPMPDRAVFDKDLNDFDS